MPRLRQVLLCALLPAGLSLAADDRFEKIIRPLLVSKCGSCHNPQVKTGGMDLTTPEGLRTADREVGLLTSGLLMNAVRWQGKVKMPPSKQLAPAELESLDSWVRDGATLPAAGATAAAGNWKERYTHWSFQPIRKPDVPEVKNAARVRNDIDRFLFSKLERAGLAIPGDAEKLVLLRRATYDLHGLPPSVEEIHSFLADEAPDAYERLIDRLLASPRYGERWGRHWLDTARFAETTGIDENQAYREAWRYREYVIDAFNRDLPYNRFMLEQVAGDICVDRSDYVRGRIATGFLALGPKAIVEQDKTKQLYDVIDEQIDTTSKAFLGLTISCARCHDHKFDPITAEDYYALASIFRSTKLYDTIEGRSSTLYFAPLAPDDVYQKFKRRQDEIAAKQLQIEAILEPEVTAYVYREIHPKLPDYLKAAYAVEKQKGFASDIAKERKLDAAILEKLVKYLKPDGSFRPFLTKWYSATPETLPQIAQEYAAMIAEPAARWRGIVDNWAAGALKEIAAGKKPTPQVRFEGFAFTKESERFFGDISFLAKTFNEKDREDGAFAIPEKDRKRYVRPETRAKVEALEKELAELKKTAPPRPPVAHAVNEDEPFNQRVFIRGNHANPGKPVAKRFPVVLAGENQPAVRSVSGRLELGQWLGEVSNPLPARVAVNRIWQWHFGEGLVRTPDNFGLRGEAPTHPELLDYLATRFVAQGWSMKQMHKLIMTSSAYRFASTTSKEAWEKDPANRLWSRFSRRRLSAEEMRDSWLAINGKLDLRMGSFLDPVAGTRTDARRGRTKMDEHFRRTVYLPVDRNGLATPMVLFDFVDSTTATGQRGETYIAPQALYLMNNDFFQQQAAAFAKRLRDTPDLTDAQRIEQGILRAWGRPASEEETKQFLEFLTKYPNGNQEAAWNTVGRLLLESNTFFYVD
ncbi:MAG TPA: DUF1549 and DUF1553 domain-containing protein [Bryobacteraceae bacterium]|nr:DUF1549 and DUF1553 domain-containing protein [Bryobacteraceae bacterium]